MKPLPTMEPLPAPLEPALARYWELVERVYATPPPALAPAPLVFFGRRGDHLVHGPALALAGWHAVAELPVVGA